MIEDNGNGGNAFPLTTRSFDGVETYYHGMTLLDFFAGSALTGLLGRSCGSHQSVTDLASLAYEFAAAMLMERMD